MFIKAILVFLFVARVNAVCVPDVENQFEKLETKARSHSFKVPTGIFHPLGYRISPFNKMGLDNHFQGVQKVPGEEAYIISGGDLRRKESHIFVMKKQKVVKKIVLGKSPYWHAGGIQMAGQYLAVPIEDFKKNVKSKVIFLKQSRGNFQKLPLEIERPGVGTSAVFLNQLENGRFLMGAYGYSGLFLYDSPDLEEGIFEEPLSILPKDAKDFQWGAQGINLVEQCDGKLFLFLFNNAEKKTPLFRGKDTAYLYSLDLKGPNLKLISQRNFECKRKCNFAAGGGISINRKGKLSILSSTHFRRGWGGKIIISEFGGNHRK